MRSHAGCFVNLIGISNKISYLLKRKKMPLKTVKHKGLKDSKLTTYLPQNIVRDKAIGSLKFKKKKKRILIYYDEPFHRRTKRVF